MGYLREKYINATGYIRTLYIQPCDSYKTWMSSRNRVKTLSTILMVKCRIWLVAKVWERNVDIHW